MKKVAVSAAIISACLFVAWASVCLAENTLRNYRSQNVIMGDLSSPSRPVLDVSPTPFQKITINLTLDTLSVRPGEEIGMSVETDADCFLTILSVGSSGKVIRLWPNRYSGPDNRVWAHTRVRIPDRKGEFKITVDGNQPFERIIAYATNQKGAILDEADFERAGRSALQSFIGSEEELADTFAARVEKLHRSVKWGVAEARVRVRETVQPTGGSELLPVIIEMLVPQNQAKSLVMKSAGRLSLKGFRVDESYDPVPIEPDMETAGTKSPAVDEQIVVLRGKLDKNRWYVLELEPNVINVWLDDEILFYQRPQPEHCKSCDCVPKDPKGTLEDVVKYLGVDKIWARGYKGHGIVIGIVDDGMLAQGRHHGPETKISGVIGGYPNDWGTKTDGHGMMCGTDALGMAPEARLYDIRILGKHGSDALKAFDWAINMYKRNKAPQILSNSWGPTAKGIEHPRSYASNPKHPLNRKVMGAIARGIIVLFAAGNCGECCPDMRCARYTGPGKSIWAPPGLPEVITVAAANLRGEWVGYSSQGPAPMERRKPDFCSITHFKGFTPCDNGTSAACPVAAGIVALLKQANPRLTQKVTKKLIMNTAKQIGPSGWNIHAGAGIIQPELAFDRLMRR